MKKLISMVILFALITIGLGCGVPKQKTDEQTPKPTGETKEPALSTSIKLATTTSVDNSGLLNHILPDFTAKTGITVDVIAVGTGQALQQARDGNVDVVIVHSPKAEQDFIDEGYGLERNYICHNQFVIVGSESDPANVVIANDAADAFKKIMDSKSKFVSRGDDSGTHKTEMKVWVKMGVTPSDEWYVEAGQGMGAVLTMANEMQGYTLTDTATYYAMIDKLNLAVIYAGDLLFENIYSVIELNPEKLPNIKKDEAKKFAEWIISPETKQLIVGFEVNGHKLFEVRDLSIPGDQP